MRDHHEIDLESLAIDEIAELLEEMGADLDPHELRQAARFVRKLGGIDEAIAAIEVMRREAA